MRVARNTVAAICAVLCVSSTWAQAAIWQELSQPELAAKGLSTGTPVYYRALRADQALLSQILAQAPLEGSSSASAMLELPMPDGTLLQFEVVNSPVLSPALAQAHSDIATYAVRGVENPAITGRLDLTPAGFHAMLSTPAGTVFIDPDENSLYRSFFKQDFIPETEVAESDRVCHLSEGETEAGKAITTLSAGYAARTVNSAYRRIYRLAVTTTSEYNQVFSNNQSQIFSNVVTAVNRVNQIYGRDLGVLLQLSIVLSQINVDSFSGLTISQILSKNQDLLDGEFGSDAYDLGHVFGTTGGGLAQLGAACTTLKAHGYSGYDNPASDVFYIDLLAHEIGHQLNATHSFNGSTRACADPNRFAITAVEPGSGSTIMAYAGICGAENLQDNSDAVFHAASIEQMNSYVFSGSGSSCGRLVATGNSIPDVDAGVPYLIPYGTPFMLSIDELIDVDGDTLSYQWDQMDVGTQATTAANYGQDLGDNPLFRSFVPKNTPTRYFPRLSTLLSGASDPAETMPTTDRDLHFRLTVRDGNSGMSVDDRVVGVDSRMGPFAILGVSPVSGGLEIQWDPAETGAICTHLDIKLLSLSADGLTYCDAEDNPALDLGTMSNLASGLAQVTLPADLSVSRARLMLACSTNIFFALSNTDLEITSAGTPVASDCRATDGEAIAHGDVSISPSATGVSLGGVKSSGGGGALFWLAALLAFFQINRFRCRIRPT